MHLVNVPLEASCAYLTFSSVSRSRKVIANIKHCISFLDHVVMSLFTTQFEEEESCCAACIKDCMGVCRIAGG